MFFVLLLFSINLIAGEWIVKTKMANMRQEPNPKSKVVYKLSQYESVQVLKRYKDWVKVKTVDDHIGWVHKSVIEELKVEDEDTEETGVETKKESNKENTSTSSGQFVVVPAENISSQTPIQTTSEIQPVSKQPEVTNVYRREEKLLSREYKIKNTSERRRVIGDHIFPSTVLFPTPIPSARFGFSQGFLNKKGEYIDVNDDNEDGIIQSNEITKKKYNYAGLSEIFDSQIVIHENVLFDLNANIVLSGGMEKKDFTSVEATPGGDIRIGPSFSYKLDNNLLLSFGLKYYLHKGINVSASYGIDGMINALEEAVEERVIDEGFWDFYFETAGMPEDKGGGKDPYSIDSLKEWFTILSSTYTTKVLPEVIKGFTKNIVVNNTKTALSPSLGFAYPITKYLGVQGIIEYQKIKDKYSTKDLTLPEISYNKLNYGLATSVDFRHLIGFSLGISLEYFREKYKLEKTNNIAFSTYYQGNGDIQLGLTLKTSKTDTKESKITYKDSYTQKLIQFTITYFF
jgi:uncharacterized protein YneR